MEAYSYAKNAKKINDNFTKENAIDNNNTMNILSNDKMIWKQMEAKKYAKNADIFECKKCNFKCSKKSDWLRHMNTRKHNMEADGSKKNATAYNCNYCNKHYCVLHYQLEFHNCTNLHIMKKQNKDLLEKTLLSGKSEFIKLQKI